MAKIDTSVRPFSAKDQWGYVFGDMAGSFVNLFVDAYFLTFCTQPASFTSLPTLLSLSSPQVLLLYIIIIFDFLFQKLHKFRKKNPIKVYVTKIFEKKKYIYIKYSYLGIAKDGKSELLQVFESF